MGDKTVQFVPLWEAVHAFNRPLTPHFRLPPTKGSAYHHCCATPTLCVVPDWFWQHRVQEYDKALQYWWIIYAPSSAEGEGGDGSGFVGGVQRKPVRAITGNNLEVARQIRRDPVLSRVQESVVKGLSTPVDGNKPYYERRNELTVHQGCRVIFSSPMTYMLDPNYLFCTKLA